MIKRDRRQDGFAVTVVLLVTVVALGAAVVAASVSAIAVRQVGTAERRGTNAFLAAESGLNSVLAKAREPSLAYDDGVDDDIDGWLQRIGLDDYTLPDGSIVRMSAQNETLERVTIRSEGIAAGGSRRVILQDFVLQAGARPPGLFADGALISIPRIQANSAVTRLRGMTSSVAEWTFEDRFLFESRIGEYVVIDSELYVVEGKTDAGLPTEQVDVRRLSDDFEDTLPGTEPATLIPFALTDTVSMSSDVLPVTDVTLYPVGTEVFVGNAVGTVTVQDEDASTLTVSWSTLPNTDLAEGSPVRRVVASAITDLTGSCPSGPNAGNIFPQGCFQQDLEDLFANTFNGMTKSELREFADSEVNRDRGGGLYVNTWPSGGNVSAVTWIDAASTGSVQSVGLCGDGAVILNTGTFDLEVGDATDTARININVSDACPFTGIIYVIGQLGLQGNIDNISGAVLVEGPGNFTNVQGTGTKSLYDPIAVRRALEGLPSDPASAGLFARLPNSWRFQ